MVLLAETAAKLCGCWIYDSLPNASPKQLEKLKHTVRSLWISVFLELLKHFNFLAQTTWSLETLYPIFFVLIIKWHLFRKLPTFDFNLILTLLLYLLSQNH